VDVWAVNPSNANLVNSPMQLGPAASQGGPWESPLPVRGAIASPPPSSQAPAWQPPATDRLVPTDEQPAPSGWRSAPVVGGANAPRLVPTDEMPAAKGNFFDDLIPQKQQTGSWQPPDAPQVPAKGMNVQGPDGAVVSFPDGTDPATVDQGDGFQPFEVGVGGFVGPVHCHRATWHRLGKVIEETNRCEGPLADDVHGVLDAAKAEYSKRPRRHWPAHGRPSRGWSNTTSPTFQKRAANTCGR
jgi:hypothetical protein